MATKKKAASKEVAVQEDKFPTTMPDYMNPEGRRGQENVGIEDMTIPRVDIIQDLSPQHKENKPEYIEGAKPGMLFNSVTGRLYGENLFFVPVFFRKEWVIWKNQNSGGGFMGAFNSKEEAEAEMQDKEYEGKETDKGEPMYEIVDTAQHFGIIIDPDTEQYEDVVISMSKSKMKVNRKFNTMVSMAGGDRFSRVYEVKAVEDVNKNNQEYYNISIRQLGFTPEAVYKHAEKLYNSISSGVRDVVREEPAPAEADEEAEY